MAASMRREFGYCLRTRICVGCYNSKRACLQYVGWGLCVYLCVLDLGEQERAWIIRDKHHGLGDAGYGGEVYEISEV